MFLLKRKGEVILSTKVEVIGNDFTFYSSTELQFTSSHDLLKNKRTMKSPLTQKAARQYSFPTKSSPAASNM